MGAIYSSQESVLGILDDSAKKWDADGPVFRLVILRSVQVQSSRWPRCRAQGGMGSPR